MTDLHVRFKFTHNRWSHDDLAAALNAVLKLHVPVEPYDGLRWCGHCVDDGWGSADWPCSTVRAVADALGVEVGE